VIGGAIRRLGCLLTILVITVPLAASEAGAALASQATAAQPAQIPQPQGAQTHAAQADSRAPRSKATITYKVSLAKRDQHVVHVEMQLPGGSGDREVQMPAWNGLYQIRDFAQYIPAVSAHDPWGAALEVRQIDKTTWRIGGAEPGAVLEYDIFADTPGPFGAQLNREHAFFNLALILMYDPGMRSKRHRVYFPDVPADWNVVSGASEQADIESGGARVVSVGGPSYDQLADSPVEFCHCQEASFDEAGTRYVIAVDADPSDYDLNALKEMVRKIVVAETEWMQDHPLERYTFIYHFPRGPAGGGMEHADSTAIDTSARRATEDPDSVAAVSAHEFFHVWNVKRIRPQSLEPIDYTHENYTRALWFAEGVTSTVADHMLARAGLIGENEYLRRLAFQIKMLETRAAHATQSAEQSSLDAWLEKYPHYRLPERSISYYNKGEIVGVLLDLAMRDATEGRKSLRDLFQWMNATYGREHRYYADSDGVRDAAEKVTGAGFSEFFRKYVAGVEEIPYDQFFQSVGLRVRRRMVASADPGFLASANFSGKPVVIAVDAGSDAEKAGLEAGDTIEQVDGKTVTPDMAARLAERPVGSTVRLRVRGAKGQREIKIRLAGREEPEFSLIEVENATPAQRAQRSAWIRGDSEK